MEIDVSKYVVNLEDFKIIKKDKWLGSCGSVSIIKDPKTDRQYIAKELQNPNIDHASDQIHFFRRLKICTTLSGHPGFPFFYGFNLNNFEGKMQSINPTIIYQLIPNGTLKENLNRHTEIHQLSTTEKQIIIIGIAIAINYMHQNKICHLDLKPDNILLNEKFYPIICDFGSSRFLNTEANHNENFVSSDVSALLYTSPEISNHQKFDEKSDVYTFAYLLYFILSGIEPKIEASNFIELNQKIQMGHRPDISCIVDLQQTLDNYPIEFGINELQKSLLSNSKETYQGGFVKLISECWDPNPQNRPTFSEIIDRLLTQRDLLLNHVDINAVNKYLENFDTIINNAGFNDGIERKNLFFEDDEAAILTFDKFPIVVTNTHKEKVVHYHYRTKYAEHKIQFYQEISNLPKKTDIPNYTNLNSLCKSIIDQAIDHCEIDSFSSIGYNLAFGYNGFPKSKTEAIKYLLIAINHMDSNSMVTLANLILDFDFTSADHYLDLVLSNDSNPKYCSLSNEMQTIAQTLLKTSSQLENSSAMLTYALILYKEDVKQRKQCHLTNLKSNSLKRQALNYIKLASDAGNLFAKKIYYDLSKINENKLTNDVLLTKTVFPPQIQANHLMKTMNS